MRYQCTLNTMNTDFKDKTHLVNYLVRKFGGDGVSIIKAVKMIFLADVYALRNYGTMVSNDEYFALKNGPMASAIDNILEQDNNLDIEELAYIKQFLIRDGAKTVWDIVRSAQEVDMDHLSELQKEAIDMIYEKYKNYSENELIKITHEYKVWKEHQQKLTGGSKREKIDLKNIFENDGDLKVSEDILNDAKILSAFRTHVFRCASLRFTRRFGKQAVAVIEQNEYSELTKKSVVCGIS